MVFSSLVAFAGQASRAPAQSFPDAASLVTVPASSSLPYDVLVDKYEVSFNAALGRYESVAGATPKTGLSLADAKAACASRGLRLPTLQEWAAAASGTPDDGVSCNTSSSSLRPTESASSPCVSSAGVYDAVGNAFEMTDVLTDVSSSGVLGNVRIDAASEENFGGAGTASYAGRQWSGAAGVAQRPTLKWDAVAAFPLAGAPAASLDDKSLWTVATGASVVRGGHFGGGEGAGPYATNVWTSATTGQATVGFRCASTAGRARLALEAPLPGAAFDLGATVWLAFTAMPAASSTATVDFFHKRGGGAGCLDGSLTGWQSLTPVPLDQSATSYGWDTSASLAGGGGMHGVCGRIVEGARTSWFAYGAVRVGPQGFCTVNDADWSTTGTGCRLARGGLASSGSTWSKTGAMQTWTQANSACAALTEGGRPAGSWRLPTVRELTDAGVASGVSHLNGVPLAGSRTFWSADARGTKHIAVDMASGGTSTPGDTFSRLAICVAK